MKLVEFAHSLGLFPPGYPEVDCSNTIAWAPDDDDSEGTLIWDTQPNVSLTDEDDDEEPWEGEVRLPTLEVGTDCLRSGRGERVTASCRLLSGCRGRRRWGCG